MISWRRALARGWVRNVLFGTVSIASFLLLPLLGVPPGVIDGVVSGAIGMLTAEAVHKTADDGYDDVGDAVFRGRLRRDSALGVDGRSLPESLHRLKETLASGIPSGVAAKYWLLLGRTPGELSRHATWNELNRYQARYCAGEPKLAPEDALRIVAAILEVPRDDSRALLGPGASPLAPRATAELPGAEAWRQRLELLHRRMVESRFHRIAVLEELAGHRIGPVRASSVSIPSQETLAQYFCLTGAVPRRGLTEVELRRRVHRLTAARVAPFDAAVARQAVLRLLDVPAVDDLLLPLRTGAGDRWAAFPSAACEGSRHAARLAYRAALAAPAGVRDSFVGHDGWHYVRAAGARSGEEWIVAAPGDDAAMLRGHGAATGRRWDLLKAERAAEVLPLLGENDVFASSIAGRLDAMRRTAAAMTDAPQYVWDPAAPSPAWAPGRRRLEQWAALELPALPAAEPIHRLAVRTRDLTRGRIALYI